MYKVILDKVNCRYPFHYVKSALVVRQGKSNENYLNPRDLPLLENND